MRIPTSRLIAYAGPGVPMAAMGLPLVVFVPAFYAGEIGLDLALVGLIFGLVRTIDTAFDLIVGNWADNTRTRFGRFKPWLVGGGLIATASTVAVFYPPQNATIFWLFFGLIGLYAGQSMVNVPHTSWGATLTEDYHERSRVYTFWQGGHLVGLILVLMLPAILDLVMGDAAPRAVHAMGFFILASLVLTIPAACALVPRTNSQLTTARIRWADVKRLLADPHLRLILVADISVNLAAGSLGTLFRFFAENARGFDDSLSSLGLLIFFLTGLLALPLWLRLAKRIGKAKASAFATLWTAVAHVIAFFLYDPDDLWISTFALMISGFSYAAPNLLLRAMLADHADDEKARGGTDRVGLLNAVLTTAMKVGYVIPVATLLPLLDFFGFDPSPDSVSSPASILALEWVWLLSLPVFMLPAIWLQFRFKADQARHQARLASDAEDAATAR
ncbi:MAG: MFS transporter [Pacificimonas sp.]